MRIRHVELQLCKSGKPIGMLTRNRAFHLPDLVAPASRATLRAEYGRGRIRGEVVAHPGDVSVIRVRHSLGEPAYLRMRHAGATDKDAPDDRHPSYFMGLWHA